jgi:tetratricopeptide (TPR) repeat protein
MTLGRTALFVTLISIAAFANSLGNGFAIDDIGIIRENPTVTNPTPSTVFLGPYWPERREGAGLYRPLTIGGFALQWRAFDGSPAGFHLVNVALHTLASLMVLLLLVRLVPAVPALAGALLFAIHPVHVEAVANAVGQAEIQAALAVLLACHLYVAGAEWSGWRRGARLAGVAGLYGVGLGSKEIAVTLPALLVAIDCFRTPPMSWSRALSRALPLHLTLGAVLATYLVLRTWVLGSTTGEVVAPELGDLSASERVLTALSIWPQYLRLLLFPVDLSADYAPGVLFPARSVDFSVAWGALTILVLLAAAWAAAGRAPLVSLGIVWFGLAILPVSHVVFPAGVLLAERTLYLPSVGLSMAVAGLIAAAWQTLVTPRARQAALALAVLTGALLFTRTVLRNPTWFDTYTVLNTLALEHPESYLAFRARAEGLARVGDVEGARESFEAAVALAPAHYSLNLQAAQFYGSRGEFSRAEQLLARAIQHTPDLPEGYLLLSEYLIRSDRAREAHAVALAGLANAGPEARLYALVSETYVAKGDLDAAVRARRAALGQAPGSTRDWSRLAELYEALGRAEEASAARARARESGG